MTVIDEWTGLVLDIGRRQGLKFGPSEKGTKFEKIFHLKFDATE